jgi:transposase InsO family protein
MRVAHPSVPIIKVCGLFGKTRQAWYEQVKKKKTRSFEASRIIEKVEETRLVLPALGGNKLFLMLKDSLEQEGIKIGRDRFFTVLRENRLLIKPKKRYVSTTNSRHHFKVWSNLVQDLVPDKPEQIWVSDITYIRIKDGFVFLSLITDAYSRKIMGFHLSTSLQTRGSLRALQMAINNRSYHHPLIHHSDRGIQYCSFLYVKYLLNNQIAISMTQDGSPYDNAIAERVNGILKTEFNLSKTFDDYHSVLEPLVNAVHTYNEYRPHMSIDYLTPSQAHQVSGELSRKWKKKEYELV